MRRPFIVLLVMVLLGFTASTLMAQDVNLLVDGGMEGATSPRGNAEINLPTGWNVWIGDTPRTSPWMNLSPLINGYRGISPSPRSGAQALDISKELATFTTALYQQVTVPVGASISASAWAYVRTCAPPENSTTCASNGDSGALTRIGIDLNGGTNPLAAGIVWSANITPHEAWSPILLNTTASGGTITFFLFATQTWPRAINHTFWDDAFLSVGTGGAPAAQPTAPLEVGFVQPQIEATDGALVHIARSGDTIDSIAVAYGLTRDQVLALNPTILSPRFIQIGQEIIIRMAQPSSAATTAADASASPISTTLAPTNAGTITAVIVTTLAPFAVTGTLAAPAAATPTETLAPPTEETLVLPTETVVAVVSAATNPAIAVITAPQAPVVSAAEGVVFPIDPANESASICVMMFEDGNQNLLQDVGEELVTGGTIALSLDGAPTASHITGDLDPTCIDDLASADYLASAQAPEGYGLTTASSLRVRTTGGAQIMLAFGAAPGIPARIAPTADTAAVLGTRVIDPAPEGVRLRDNLGFLAFGAAGFVLVFGLGAAFLLRRR